MNDILKIAQALGKGMLRTGYGSKGSLIKDFQF